MFKKELILDKRILLRCLMQTCQNARNITSKPMHFLKVVFLVRRHGYGMTAPMKPALYQLIVGFCVTQLLFACAAEPRGEDVWNTYDVRHPVAGNVPVYNAYPIDNDSYYAPPDCTIMDSPACGE